MVKFRDEDTREKPDKPLHHHTLYSEMSQRLERSKGENAQRETLCSEGR